MNTLGCAQDYVKAVNDFIFVRHDPGPCDAIFVPGSSHREHVLKAAEMYHEGWARVIVPSGRYAIGSEGFTADPAFDTEWAWMRSILLNEGVPDKAILRQDQATYTWENALFSRQVTDMAGLQIRNAMLCCVGSHARRALLYYQAAYPETRWLVCPADLPGFGPKDWYLSPEGQDRILGEVRRLGSQVNEVFARMLKEE